MTNEFRTLNAECSNLVPQGPGYENITLDNQVCAVVGAVPGETTVNGLRYLKLSYNYEWTHMWRVKKPPSTISYTRSHTTLSRTLVSSSLSALLFWQLISSSPSSSPNLLKLEPLSHSNAEPNRLQPPFLKSTTSRRPLLPLRTQPLTFVVMVRMSRRLWLPLRR